MAIRPWLRRPVLVALVVLASATAPRADEVCVIARALLSAEEASKAVLLARSDAAAAPAIADLALRLDRVASYAARLAGPGAGAADLRGPVSRIMESRRELVALYRLHGLAVARAYALQAEFIATRGDLRRLVRERPACAGTAEGEADQAGRDEAVPAPTGGVGAAPPALRALSAGGEPGRSGESGPPVADARVGVGIVAVLCLLLALFLVFDSKERREDARFLCHLRTRLRSGGVVEQAVIVEISRGGAKLQTRARLAPGARGVILVLGAPRAFRVAWATPSFAGVTFRRKLEVTEEELSLLSAQPEQPAAARATRVPA